MTEEEHNINYLTHKTVNLKEYGSIGNNETIEEAISILQGLLEKSNELSAFEPRIRFYEGHNGFSTIDAWIMRTPEEIAKLKVNRENSENAHREYELRKLAELKAKYEG